MCIRDSDERDNDVDLARRAATTLDNQDDADLRLRQALDRMDALEQEVKFHFFDSVLEDDPTRLSFPDLEPRWAKWMQILQSESSSHEAMITLTIEDSKSMEYAASFVADICYSRSVPAELQEWCLGECEYRCDSRLTSVLILVSAFRRS